MKLKRIALLDLSALARVVSGPAENDDVADAREPTPPPASWTRCGTELDHEAHCAELEAPGELTPDDDTDPLAIEIALDWVRAHRDRTRRTAFERALLRTLQARLRRNGARSARRRSAEAALGPSRGRGRAR